MGIEPGVAQMKIDSAIYCRLFSNQFPDLIVVFRSTEIDASD